MHKARVGIVLLGLGLAALSLGQTAKVTLDAIQDGKNVGSINLIRTVKGSMMTSVNRMNIQQGTTPTKIELTTTLDSTGKVLSRSAEIVQGQNNIRLSATFTDTTATMTIAAKGKSEKHSFPALKGVSTKDPSTWWFVKGKPKPGTKVVYQTFNMLRGQWQKVESTYVGKKSLKVGNKTVMANQISEKRNEGTFSVYVDDAGMPYLLEEAKMKFVRKM